ncbi:hypothetical protein [Streptosporangium sp. NPDC051022]
MRDESGYITVAPFLVIYLLGAVLVVGTVVVVVSLLLRAWSDWRDKEWE